LIQIKGGVIPSKGPEEYENHKIPKRGGVREFSSRSRMRLMEWCAKLNRDTALPLFVTLTYPGILTPDLRDPKKWKRDIDVFGKWLLKKWPGCCAIWKLEPQRCRVCKPPKTTKTLCTCGANMMAPHYHLIIWGIGFMPHIELARKWYAIVGSGQEDHLQAGIQVKKALTKNGVMCYAGKNYMGKDCQAFAGMVGRFWGILGRKNFDVSPSEEIELKVDATKLLRRVARKYLLKKGIRVGSARTLNLFTCKFKMWIRAGEWAVWEIEDRRRNCPRVRFANAPF
jgi:hypothetical protein